MFLPCDVFNPILPAAAIGAIWALGRLWVRRGTREGWTAPVVGLVLLAIGCMVSIAVLAPGGCPGP